MAFTAPQDRVATRGTINILLADSKGAVLVTDSRASDLFGKKVNDSSQKLFQLDDQTVCSIAGFGYDPGPHRELSEAAGGVIQAYADGLKESRSSLDFHDKTFALAWELGMRLAGLETAYQYAKNSRAPRTDDMTILFVGFDKGGQLNVEKLAIAVVPSGAPGSKPQFHGEVSQMEFHTVGQAFVALTAGIDDDAKIRLKHPSVFKNETGLHLYAESLREGKAAQLPIGELEGLARTLELDVADATTVVGGPIQVARLQNKSIALSLPDDLSTSRPPYTNGILVGSGAEGFPFFLAIYTEPHTVFVDFHCVNSAFRLDEMILLGGRYEGCNFFFDGGEFYRDPTVSVNGGKLILGPHVDRDSYFFRRAHELMPELEVIDYQQLPNAKEIATRMFRGLPQ